MPSAWRSRFLATTPTRDPGRGLPGAGPLQDRPGVGVAVLLHAGEVGVAGPGPGQRRVAGQRGERGRVDRVGRHDRLPLGPLAVADPDRDRAAEGQAVPHAAEDLDLVLLERHPRAAAVARAGAGPGRARPRRWSPRPRPARPRAWRRARARATHPRSTSASSRHSLSRARRVAFGRRRAASRCSGGPRSAARASGAAPPAPSIAVIDQRHAVAEQPVQRRARRSRAAAGRTSTSHAHGSPTSQRAQPLPTTTSSDENGATSEQQAPQVSRSAAVGPAEPAVSQKPCPAHRTGPRSAARRQHRHPAGEHAMPPHRAGRQVCPTRRPVSSGTSTSAAVRPAPRPAR